MARKKKRVKNVGSAHSVGAHSLYFLQMKGVHPAATFEI